MQNHERKEHRPMKGKAVLVAGLAALVVAAAFTTGAASERRSPGDYLRDVYGQLLHRIVRACV
jgi:hypothetical protein